jgi:hypothetical protein
LHSSEKTQSEKEKSKDGENQQKEQGATLLFVYINFIASVLILD